MLACWRLVHREVGRAATWAHGSRLGKDKWGGGATQDGSYALHTNICRVGDSPPSCPQVSEMKSSGETALWRQEGRTCPGTAEMTWGGGWFGHAEGHRDAALRREGNLPWLSLLLLAYFFFNRYSKSEQNVQCMAHTLDKGSHYGMPRGNREGVSEIKFSVWSRTIWVTLQKKVIWIANEAKRICILITAGAV